MSIKEEFEKAFEKVRKDFTSQEWDGGGESYEYVNEYGIALWAAKWMAEYFSNKLERESDCEYARQLAKELS